MLGKIGAVYYVALHNRKFKLDLAYIKELD